MLLQRRLRLPVTTILLLTAFGACDSNPSGPDAPLVFAAGKNVAKLKVGEALTIPIQSHRGGTAVPFTATSTGSCATFVKTATAIVVTGVTANCVQTVDLAAESQNKTLTLNVYDPLTMDIGEGLLISYVNHYTWRWNDGGSGGDLDVTFWHPVVPSGWYAIGSLLMGNYVDVNASLDQPMIIVKDISTAQNLLAAPTGYTLVWNDLGSGASNDGSVWRANCPTGYVSFGSVVQVGYAAPSVDDMRCVAQRFTTPGTVGDHLYHDVGTGANTDLAAYRVGPSVLGASPDGRYAMWTRTSVGCPGWDPIANCETSRFNLLLVPMTVMENSDDAAIEPKLTGFTPFVATGPVFYAGVRVPFTMIPTEDPLCGTIVCSTAAVRVTSNITTSPFYYLERQETYSRLGNAIDNRQGTTAVPLGPFSYTNAFNETNATSFSQEIGIKITVSGDATFLGAGSKYSVELSAKFAWSQSHSQTYSQSQTSAFGPFQVQPGDFAEIIQVTTQFRGRSEQGIVTGTAFGAGQNTAKFLRYPLD